ncbi:citryl-CoA lyase [Ramlibacter terrae]|uniref:citrate synthase (unknown stereospecificity) n=1 Tax=Ramlibacter terrae TaxID=2732511 RepID=A0ABX6P167_9BURK|nr:citryl-CoA lyase [Ramlibacter terrae]
MSAAQPPRTRIARHTVDAVYVRDLDLVRELIGKVSFTEMIVLQLTGKRPTPLQTRVLDAVLVTLMEHGFTPSSIVTRLIYDSTPEAMQSAVAAGLLGVGGTFIGTMEGAAALLDDIVQSPDMQEAARAVAQQHAQAKRPMPGFGHPFHKPDDPRAAPLLELARAEGAAGRHIEALTLLAAEVDRAYGRHLTINVTGAVAAVLGEIGVPAQIMRGLAVVSRAAGLVGHIHEEQQRPSARYMWDPVAKNIPYETNPT